MFSKCVISCVVYRIGKYNNVETFCRGDWSEGVVKLCCFSIIGCFLIIKLLQFLMCFYHFHWVLYLVGTFRTGKILLIYDKGVGKQVVSFLKKNWLEKKENSAEENVQYKTEFFNGWNISLDLLFSISSSNIGSP